MSSMLRQVSRIFKIWKSIARCLCQRYQNLDACDPRSTVRQRADLLQSFWVRGAKKPFVVVSSLPQTGKEKTWKNIGWLGPLLGRASCNPSRPGLPNPFAGGRSTMVYHGIPLLLRKSHRMIIFLIICRHTGNKDTYSNTHKTTLNHMQGKDGNILTYAYIHPQKVIWTSIFGLPIVCYAKVQVALKWSVSSWIQCATWGCIPLSMHLITI